MNKRLLIAFGTRPEAIKLAPLIREASVRSGKWDVHTCSTGQHSALLRQVLDVFQLQPTYTLKVMKAGQTLSQLSARLLAAVPPILQQNCFDAVIVQGDTTTAFCVALAAFYEKIPVVHIEAGLRTNNRYAPFPEEINRRLLSHIASYHFAPTSWAKQNLLCENVPAECIYVVGNTIVDALKHILEIDYPLPRKLEALLRRPLVMITHHRRESFGEPIDKVFAAIREIAATHPDIAFVFPVHPNPAVRQAVDKHFRTVSNVVTLPPLTYPVFVKLMRSALFLITDSGGIQEEATALGKKVLLTRNTTERPEAVTTGWVKLVGDNPASIVSAAEELLHSAPESPWSGFYGSPYGDGHASEKILDILEGVL